MGENHKKRSRIVSAAGSYAAWLHHQDLSKLVDPRDRNAAVNYLSAN